MIGKSSFINITSDISKNFEERQQIIMKQNELKQRLEELKNELEEVKTYFNTVVSMDDLNVLVQDIKSSFELFVNNTPRNHDDFESRIKALEEKLSKFEIIQTNVEATQPTTIKKEIPKLNLEKKKRN